MEHKKRWSIDITNIIIFLIVTLSFTISLLSFFPGILTSDNVDQINQAMTNLYTTGHPIIHSFIIGNLTKLGGIWVPALLQIVVFATIWVYMCKTLRKYNDGTVNRVIQVVFTIIICVIPLNFAYAITLWKDILYSYAILLLLVLIYIGIKERYQFTNVQIVLIALSTVGIMKLRKNGLPIGFLIFCILFVLNIIKNKDMKTAMKMIGAFALIFALVEIVEMSVNRLPGAQSGSVLNSTKIYCFSALLNDDIELEEDEKEFLNTILDLEEWKEKFDKVNGTPILFSENIDNSVLRDKDNEQRFNEIFIKYAKQRKRTVIKHFLNINSIWWSVKDFGGMHSVVLDNSSVSQMSYGIYDNKPILELGNTLLTKYTHYTLSNKVLYVVLYRPATALYVSIIIGVCIIVKGWKKGEKGYIMLLFPMILNTGTYIILISSPDHRYFYPSFMTAYFFILLFINMIIKNKKSIENDTEKREI